MRRPLLLVLLALCLVIVFLYCKDPFGLGNALLPKTSIEAEDGSVYTAEGIVTRVQDKSGYLAVTLKVGKESILVRLSADVTDPYDLVGRRAEAVGKISLPDGRRNPGCFDYRLYLKGRRIFHIMDVSRFRFTAGEVRRPLFHLLSVLKGRFYAKVRPFLSDQQFQLLAGLLFGETAYMDEDLYEEFRLNGIAHVLAVSGLHVGLLYSVILKLLGGRRNIRTTIAVSASLLAYAALSSFSVSVLRASFMIALNMLAFHLKRRYDLTSAATLCAIVFLIQNPYRLFDSGMQLSFCAAYTMGVALPWAVSKGTELSDKYRKKWIKAAFDIFAPSVMVQLGMTPLILFQFTTFSPVGILINPLAVILAGLLLPAGLLCFLVSIIFSGLPLAAAAGVCKGFAQLMLLLSRAGQYAMEGLYVPSPPLSAVLLYYAMFFWFFSETRVILNRRRRYGASLAAALLVMALAVGAPFGLGLSESLIPWKHDTHTVTFVDVGQGDCIHISIDGFNILVDGGGRAGGNIAKRTLRPYLLKNGISRVDLAIITHMDTDHSLGILQLQEIFDVRETVVLGDENRDCGVCLIEAGGVRMLLMADADMETEQSLCDKYGDALSCDIIKIGHHGSAYSTSGELLETARPAFAVISCGRNNIYGHPAARVVELLQDSGIIYARTDEDGAVYLKSVSEGQLVFQNAAKDRLWLIPRTKQAGNTPQKR